MVVLSLPDPPDPARSSSETTNEDEDDRLMNEREEDDKIEREVKLNNTLIRISLVAGLGGLLFGFDTGVVSGALLVIGTALGGQRLTTFQEEFLVSSALLGALLGSLVAGKLANRYGRKPIIIFSSILFILGALEQCAAQVVKEVYLGRILVGVAVGLSSSIIPIYLAELAPSKYRGRIVTSLVVLITAGQVLAYSIDAVFYRVEKGWRFMFGLGAVPALIQLCLAFNLPESPHFLIRNEKVAPARIILRSIYTKSSEAALQRRIERIELDVRSKRPQAKVTSWSEMLRSMEEITAWKEEVLDLVWRDRANRRALIVAVGLQAFQQCTAFNTLMYYSGKILEAAHFPNPAAFAMLVAVTNFICTIIALRLIDRLGRRPLLLATFLVMAVGMLILGVSFFFIPRSLSTKSTAIRADGPGLAAYIALLGIAIFCSAYALGIGNVAWVVQSEVFSHDLKGLGTSLATATNWTANLIVSSTYLHLTKLITPGGAFCLFSSICLLGFLFTYVYLPETKGLALSEIKALFGEGVLEDREEEGRYHRVGDSGDEA